MIVKSEKLELRSLPLFVIMIIVSYGLLFIFLIQFPGSHYVPAEDFADEDASEQQHLFSPSTSSSSVQKAIFFQLPLDPDDRFRVFWTLDYKTETATIEVRANLQKESDWFAIGFSDYGNVSNADLCVLWFDLSLKAHFDDTWTDDESYLNLDDKNDCSFMRLKRRLGEVRIVFQRKFNTCDRQDYVIEEGTTHIIYATGSGPLKRLTNIRIADHVHGLARTRFLKIMTPDPLLPVDTKGWRIINNRTKIPATETTYWCSTHSLPKEFESKHHVIQYEAVIQKGNEALVHHMELFHCEVPIGTLVPDYNGPCDNASKPPILEACKRVIAAWAMGATPLVYPDAAGLPVGGAQYSRYVMLEVHYDNPTKRDDWIDSSGMKLYYTDHLRKFDVGVLEIGLEYTDKNSIPPSRPAFDMSSFCVSECTRIGLPESGITIFASQLHTHLTGIRVWTRHVRGGTELPELNRDDHYSQHFQEIRILKRPVQLLPGDALINYCRYDTRSRSNMTLGGFGIREEMCVNYLHYYPKTGLEVCKSSIDTRFLRKYFGYVRDFDADHTNDDLRVKGIADNYQSIHWSPNKVRSLSKLYDSAPLSMQCNRSSGQRFPGNWEGVPVTRIYAPLNSVKRSCGSSPSSSPYAQTFGW